MYIHIMYIMCYDDLWQLVPRTISLDQMYKLEFVMQERWYIQQTDIYFVILFIRYLWKP